jgi:hypothetical protein
VNLPSPKKAYLWGVAVGGERKWTPPHIIMVSPVRIRVPLLLKVLQITEK